MKFPNCIHHVGTSENILSHSKFQGFFYTTHRATNIRRTFAAAVARTTAFWRRFRQAGGTVPSMDWLMSWSLVLRFAKIDATRTKFGSISMPLFSLTAPLYMNLLFVRSLFDSCRSHLYQEVERQLEQLPLSKGLTGSSVPLWWHGTFFRERSKGQVNTLSCFPTGARG